MTKEKHCVRILLFTVFMFFAHTGLAETINLSSPTILGELNLPSAQLNKIKDAVIKAMGSNIDTEIQCGEVKLDCVVRAARQWNYEGSTFREIVVNIHTVGHASFTVENAKGQGWPTIAVNSAGHKQAKK
ncbi:MAG: hypothetical protein PVF82_18665 [Gammaproteobacteria bacterium]|jgi:hypothetical protein